jgi:hypothetical protein
MSNKRDRPEPRERRSPDATVANVSDDFIKGLNIPELPEGIPARLEDALRVRINALLYQLREAKRERYLKVLEVRLAREAHRAVLTAHELHLRDADVLYATFRRLVHELGYKSVDVGFARAAPPEAGAGPTGD